MDYSKQCISLLEKLNDLVAVPWERQEFSQQVCALLQESDIFDCAYIVLFAEDFSKFSVLYSGDYYPADINSNAGSLAFDKLSKCCKKAFESSECVIFRDRSGCSGCSFEQIHSESLVLSRRLQGGTVSGILNCGIRKSLSPEELSIVESCFTTISVIVSLALNVASFRNKNKILGSRLVFFEKFDREISDSILIIDRRFKIAYGNHSAELLFGYSVDEMIGRKPDFFLAPDANTFNEDIARAMETGTQYHSIFKGMRRDGSLFDCEYKVVHLTFDFRRKVKSLVCLFRDVTHALKTQSELENTLEKFNTVVQKTHDIVFVLDPEGKFISVNAQVRNLIGYGVEEVEGQPLLSFIHPEDRPAFRQMLENPGDERIMRYRMISCTGETKYVLISIRALGKDEQQSKHIAGVIHDCTREKKDQDSIQSLRSFLENLIAHASVWIDFYDIKADKITIWNKFAEQLTGFTLDEICRPEDYFRKLYPNRAEREKIEIQVRQLIEQRKTITNKLTTIYVQDGSERIISWNIQPIIDDELHVLGLLRIGRDVTETQKVRRQLIESEENFRALAEKSPDVIIRFDVKGRIEYINPIIQKFTGKGASEFVNRYPGDFGVFPESVDRLMSGIREAVEQKQQVSIEFELKRKGKTKVFEVRLEPMFGTDGVVSGVLGLGRDISEKHELEFQLRQTEKMRAIGQLAGGIAHDFNNQLTAILGFSDLLAKLVKGESKAERCVRMIVKASERSAQLTSKLLAFARRGKNLIQPMDIHEVVREVISLVSIVLDKRITVTQQLFAVNTVISGDAGQIQNALLNLALNARDAMPDGGDLIFRTENIRITDGKFGFPSGEYIKISVEDTGIGMPEEIHEHIFEPFFTTKSNSEGVGMGLSAVYGTVQNHHGVIEFTSSPGNGTTFDLYFPLVKEKVFKVKQKAAHTVVPLQLNILIVDDEDLIRNMAIEMFSVLGCRVIAQPDGKSGVNYYRQHWEEINIVLLDVEMPGMNGLQTFMEMKKINPEIRALVISGYSKNSEVNTMLEWGAKGFLQKPFRLDQIIETVYRITGTPME